MKSSSRLPLPLWSLAISPAACTLLAIFWGGELGGLLLALTGASLIASVLVAVFHA